MGQGSSGWSRLDQDLFSNIGLIEALRMKEIVMWNILSGQFWYVCYLRDGGEQR